MKKLLLIGLIISSSIAFGAKSDVSETTRVQIKAYLLCAGLAGVTGHFKSTIVFGCAAAILSCIDCIDRYDNKRFKELIKSQSTDNSANLINSLEKECAQVSASTIIQRINKERQKRIL